MVKTKQQKKTEPKKITEKNQKICNDCITNKYRIYLLGCISHIFAKTHVKLISFNEFYIRTLIHIQYVRAPAIYASLGTKVLAKSRVRPALSKCGMAAGALLLAAYTASNSALEPTSLCSFAVCSACTRSGRCYQYITLN